MRHRPDFLIIGAMKAGTTTLYRDLEPHPQLFLPPEKEPDTLVRFGDDMAAIGSDYASLFGAALGGQMWRHYPVRSGLHATGWFQSVYASLACHMKRLLYKVFAASPGECLLSALASFKLPTLHLAKSDGMQANRHSIRGNSVRFEQQPIETRADEAWRDEMPKAQKLVVIAMATPMFVRYGYPIIA